MSVTRSTGEMAIRTVRLTKMYGSSRGILDLDLEVRQGEIFGFLGPNGAGKTTTIRLLLDLIKPTSGSARVLGLDCVRDSVAVRRLVGYLPGEVSLYEWMTGVALLDFLARAGNRPAPLRGELLERLDLDPSGRIGRFSHGMKQKLALVSAMQHDPAVLLLDEPTSGLDPLIQQEFYVILRDLKNRGRTIFLSSHVLAEVERLCDRVGIIREGRLVAVEEVGTLRNRVIREMRVTFAVPIDARLLEGPGVRVVSANGCEVRLSVAGGVGDLVRRLAEHEVADLEYDKPSLEALFLGYYSEREGHSGV